MSGKRTSLMSNDVRRELAKQMRATREERRVKLDARHKYLIGMLEGAVPLNETEVEEAIVGDDKVIKC